jgi:uncharacterized protein (TIGR02118 family)
MYPKTDDSTFDMTYYTTKHAALVSSLLTPAGMKSFVADEGLGSMAPDQPAPFMCIGHMTFETVEAFQHAFGPNAQTIVGDIPNFTNVQPVVQISRIV